MRTARLWPTKPTCVAGQSSGEMCRRGLVPSVLSGRSSGLFFSIRVPLGIAGRRRPAFLLRLEAQYRFKCFREHWWRKNVVGRRASLDWAPIDGQS